VRRRQEAQDGVLGDELVAGGRLGSQTELKLMARAAAEPQPALDLSRFRAGGRTSRGRRAG
jgi:hypothetical protein